MQYKFAIETPSGTERTSPKETKINLVSGIVDQVMIEFPAGCAGLVGVRVLQGLFQLWPLTSGEWFVTDNFTVVFPEHFELPQPANQLRVETYNEDDTYDHTIDIAFTISAIAPDPLRQVAEIMAKREREAPPVTADQVIPIGLAVAEIQALLYSIHAADFPALFNYIEQLRE